MFRLTLPHRSTPRERIIRIFREMADLNNALGEKYKVHSYHRAVESLQTNLHQPLESIEDLRQFPGLGAKLLRKAEEILLTGKLAELETKTKPKLKAIQELTQVHGFGPRAAAHLFDKEGIFTLEELFQRAPTLTCLTDQQRVGLHYFYDINEKIPLQESVLHENYLKKKSALFLGPLYEIHICGSYRRRHPFSGDIDAIVSRTLQAPPLPMPVASTGVLGDFINYLKNNPPFNDIYHTERIERNKYKNNLNGLLEESGDPPHVYLEATMVQGPLKYMGMGRLPPRKIGPAGGNPNQHHHSNNNNNNNNNNLATNYKYYKARRVDIRLMETKSVPTALLTFTGSKNFNVIMRQAAINKGYLLNEYGLFKVGTPEEAKALFNSTNASADNNNNNNNKKLPNEEMGIPREELEKRRVHVTCEKDVFDVLGMPFAKPENRDP